MSPRDRQPSQQPQRRPCGPLSGLVASTVVAAALILAAMPPQHAHAGLDSTVSFDVHDADLHEVFQMVGKMASVNVLIDPQIRGKVTFALKDVTAAQAFNLLAGITGNKVGGVCGVVVVAKEEVLRHMLGPVRATVHQLRYARAEEIATAVQKVMGKDATAVAHPATNSLIIRQGP